MAQRTTALCDGKVIGIESIFTVINGKQINIKDKVETLREKSRRNELFCPCGCGANLILVAGDKQLREQHFRIKDTELEKNCHMITEGAVSVDSKIVLKCWLDDKLKADDIESRVPIHAVDDINRKYEFSFISMSRKLAVNYCHLRANLSDEKLTILDENSIGIKIIHIVDKINGGTDGQYPERLMKIQDRQGYCLLLSIENYEYEKAFLSAVFYVQDADGLWYERQLTNGPLSEFSITDNGDVLYRYEKLGSICDREKKVYFAHIENEKKIRAEKERIRKKAREQELLEYEKRKVEEQQKREEEAKRQLELREQQRIENERKEQERQKQKEEFYKKIESIINQQEHAVKDPDGNRLIKCEYCGKISTEGDFIYYGGPGRINIGTCRECNRNSKELEKERSEMLATLNSKKDRTIHCPDCGGELRIKPGRYGDFYGCSNFPNCRFTSQVRKK